MLFPQFSELPPELQEYIVYWASGNYGDPGMTAALMLVSKVFLIWASHFHYRIVIIENNAQLERLLGSSFFRETAAQSVHILVLTDLPPSSYLLICTLLKMTTNLFGLFFHIHGGFVVPDTVALPKLRAVMSGTPEGRTDEHRLSFSMARQLTHFPYLGGLHNDFTFEDLLRWLRQPFDSLTHILMRFDDNCAKDIGEWQELFRQTRDKVLPRLPPNLRVFIIQPPWVPHAEDLDEDLRSFINGTCDSRIVFSPEESSDGMVWSDQLYLRYAGEREVESVHIYETEAKGIWISAEEFIQNRNRRFDVASNSLATT
ncbi:hypothetical protein DL96DRAFT_1650800 [Flagelloscypha sp. PMI_526]|nr:hypothetical protein DL96DRAFT_1650800 [Flagelloscypha sp. PMI_526]